MIQKHAKKCVKNKGIPFFIKICYNKIIGVILMKTNDKYLWIVNKQNVFNKTLLNKFDMLPTRDTDGRTYIEKETKEAFIALKKLMEKKHGITLFLTSAGRTVETQQKVMDDLAKEMSEEELLKTVALPGTSEHHTGLAIDVKPEIAHSPMIQRFVDALPLPERIAYIKQPDRETKKQMYETLHTELEQFGFIVRYTKEKQDITGVRPEPWHLRYVGIENAKAINASGLCLEEYVEQLQTQSEQQDASSTTQEVTEETLQQVVIVHPVVTKVFEEASKAKEEDKVQ